MPLPKRSVYIFGLAFLPIIAVSGTLQGESITWRGSSSPRAHSDILWMLEKDPGRKEASLIPVRHLGKNELGRQVAESAHFRVIHDQTKPVAERVARAAERLRPALHRKWFGDVSLEWDGKCVIYLHANHKSYVTKTKQWNALGHARTLMMGDQVSSRSIHLPWGLSNFFDEILPHELTHAVLAVRFRGRLPRWANEGMAMLSESQSSIDDRRKSLEQYRKKDDLFGVDVLMKTEEEGQMNTLEYYAQAMSLVQFFVAEQGHQAFSRFLGDSLLVGYEPALKKHYGIANFAELERRWSAYAFSKIVEPPPGLALVPSRLRFAPAQAKRGF
jgi:hypothetical protein